MPTLSASRNVSLEGRTPIKPQPAPAPPLTPVHPPDLSPSTVMISSLPGIATNVDGVTRQFNGRGTVPTRRIVTPR
jgi:hypothetical protein